MFGLNLHVFVLLVYQGEFVIPWFIVFKQGSCVVFTLAISIAICLRLLPRKICNLVHFIRTNIRLLKIPARGVTVVDFFSTATSI